MALKTFNVDAETYRAFSEHCKKEGISMSKKVENFMKKELENLKIFAGKNAGKRNMAAQTSDEHPMGKYC